MEYMIINGFNTSTIPNCVVTDFGEVEAAKPKVSETATLFGVNGNYRVLDGAYESYERTFAFYLPRTVDPLHTRADGFDHVVIHDVRVD